MRALVVAPGPQFSTWDVFRGWCRGLLDCGVDVLPFDLDVYLNAFSGMKKVDPDSGDIADMFPDGELLNFAGEFLQAELYRWWPDLVVVVQATFIPTHIMDIIRTRRHKLVILHTESPYEDDRQVEVAEHADINLLNDPINIDRFERAHYMPHAYDPTVHRPGPVVPKFESDVCFVGTGMPSRIAWLERVDWTGINLELAGHWPVDADSPLAKFVTEDDDHCRLNDQTADTYRSAKMGFNIYRTEAEREGLSFGWAMGPREVELAACGTFFARQPRGEGDELFPMLPTFETPGELEAVIREWLPRTADRETAALKAREAIEDRTFSNHAAALLELAGF